MQPDVRTDIKDDVSGPSDPREDRLFILLNWRRRPGRAFEPFVRTCQAEIYKHWCPVAERNRYRLQGLDVPREEERRSCLASKSASHIPAKEPSHPWELRDVIASDCDSKLPRPPFLPPVRVQ